MTIFFRNFAGSFKSFINNQGKYILFTSLFYSLWLTKDIVQNQNYDLHNFAGRMIGVATMHGYDINARVSLFYKSVGLLIFSFFVFNLVAYFIFRKKPSLLNSIEIKIINYVSLAGIFLFLFSLFGYKVSGTMDMLYFLHKLILVGIFLKLCFFRRNHLSLYDYTFIILLSISIFFFISDCIGFINTSVVPDFFNTTFSIACMLMISFHLILKNAGDLTQTAIEKITFCVLPLLFLPIISVLKDEIFLILKTRGVHLSSPLFLYIALIAVLTASIILRLTTFKKRVRPSQKKLIAFYYFPIFIFSIIIYSKYSYFANFSGETFEIGNKFLPIMEYRLFGVIPTLEKFNTHLLSDYFFCAIYYLFNGSAGPEIALYDFLSMAVSYALYYYLVFYLTRNAFLALFCILVFPFCPVAMLPEQFSFGVFAIFALQKIISRNQSLKNYLVFFITLTGLMLWRIDLGYTCLVVMVVLLVYYHFRAKEFKINAWLAVKGLSIVLIAITVIAVCFSLFRGLNLFDKIPYVLNYITSAQSYGIISLGQSDQPIFKMHYFVFPTLVVFILLGLLLRFGSFNKSKGQRLSYLALLFTCLFYIINFNRGIVRHGLIESVDYFTSSYIYIIIPGSFLFFFPKQTHPLKFIVFFSVTFFLLLNYRLPSLVGSQSFLELTMKKIQSGHSENLSRIVSRVEYDSAYKCNNDSLFIKFIAENTKPDETFIDFSNNPMMYFHTKKITPSYFFQNPLCSHNDFLQDRFIADLKEYKTPYVIFASTSIKGMDDVDNVPTALRHYRIAEHFYIHYEPYIVVGRFRLWKAKTTTNLNKKDTLYSFVRNLNHPDSDWTLKKKIQIKFRSGKTYLARLVVRQNPNLILKTAFSNDSFSQMPEFVSENLAYCLLTPRTGNCELTLQNLTNTLNEFQIIECDYVPDFYSEKFLSYDFFELPHIWGAYDGKVSKEPVLFEDSKNIQLIKNELYTYKIPENLNRAAGNTVLITCKNRGNAVQKITLSIGNHNEKSKSKINFTVIVSDKEENYAVRISGFYKWYSGKINELHLSTDCDSLTVSDIKITKGI